MPYRTNDAPKELELLEAVAKAAEEFVYASETDPGWPSAKYNALVLASTALARHRRL